MPEAPPLLSVVIAVHNEAGNVMPLAGEVARALEGAPQIAEQYEIVFVDDGCTDSTALEIRHLMTADARIRLVVHEHRTGLSAAIRSGVRHASAPWIMTCDGDGQNDPADMPRLAARAWEGGQDAGVIVCGWRTNRQDSWRKRMASRFANAVRKAVLHDGCPDTGCSLKLFRRDTYLMLPFFNGLHRFMPALFRHYGHTVINMPVNDRPRRLGVSKSDIVGRGLKGLADLLGVYWLLRRTPKAHKATETH